MELRFECDGWLLSPSTEIYDCLPLTRHGHRCAPPALDGFLTPASLKTQRHQDRHGMTSTLGPFLPLREPNRPHCALLSSTPRHGPTSKDTNDTKAALLEHSLGLFISGCLLFRWFGWEVPKDPGGEDGVGQKQEGTR
jgi:hypothetical protein